MESTSSEEKLRFGNSMLPPRKNTEEGRAGEERVDVRDISAGVDTRRSRVTHASGSGG